MAKRIVFATGNAGKMKEVRMILKDLGIPVVSMKEAGIDIDITEDGKTFAENAEIKARAVYEQCQDIVLADDSGLEIDHLNKEPGIYSARYMGEDTSYHIKNANLIQRLSGVPDPERTARFVCAIAAVLPDGTVLHSYGTIEGIIGYEEQGRKWFRIRSDLLSSAVWMHDGTVGAGDQKRTESQRKSSARNERAVGKPSGR